jgi:hypothetical protein
MGSFLELLYDVLFSPAAAMRQIAARRTVGQAVAAFLLSIVIPALAIYFAVQSSATARWTGALFAVAVCLRFAMWFVGAAVLQLIAEFFGGRGSGLGLFAAIGFAHLPLIFMVPLAVAAMLLPSGAAPPALAAGGLALVFWVLALTVVAIQGAHELSAAKAVLVLLTPFLALALAAFAAAVFIGAALWPQLG